MIINFNIGVLGHVDSGKTTLAKKLSEIGSTAAFDKNPQSQQRKITLDLGFSASAEMPPTEKIKEVFPQVQSMQFTFVDCPGHASLIRTIIGGAQIIDLMILVIDAQKGIQTQTAECIVIGEILKRQLVVAVNKIDALRDDEQKAYLEKLHQKLRKALSKTAFGSDVPIINISAQNDINLHALLECVGSQINPSKRHVNDPFIMYIDHCFSIKGQGTICTGTILQGQVNVNDLIEICNIGEQRKIKSMQIFRRSVQSASMGDRVGVCVTQFNAKLLERGIMTRPGFLKPIYAVCIDVKPIRYYKLPVKSKSKLHITIGHETVMAKVTLFTQTESNGESAYNPGSEYEFLEELLPSEDDKPTSNIFALLEFDSPIWSPANAALIASKLDMDSHAKHCRLAFWGNIQWLTENRNYSSEALPSIFKRKMKIGSVLRIVNENEIIVQNLFKKDSKRDAYIGKAVELSTGEVGKIDSSFGQTTKLRVSFQKALNAETLVLFRSGKFSEVRVILKYKKYIFNKKLGLCQ